MFRLGERVANLMSDRHLNIQMSKHLTNMSESKHLDVYFESSHSLTKLSTILLISCSSSIATDLSFLCKDFGK